MGRRLPSLNALRALEAAGRLGSVSAAAVELNVSPGAVSRHITLLEDHFECALFQRERYGMRLTDRGRLLFDAVAAAFTGIDQASARLLDAPSTLLTVRCYTSLASEWLVPRIRSFRQVHPEIELRLKVSLEPADMTRDDADVAIVARRQLAPEVSAEPLFPAWYAPVCAPEVLREGNDPAALHGLQLIYAPLEMRMWHRWFALAGLELDITAGLKLETMSLTYQAARSGAGVALGQLFMVMDDLASGALVLPAPLVLDDRFDHLLVCREDRQSEHAIAHFRNWLLQEAERTNRRVEAYLAARDIIPLTA